MTERGSLAGMWVHLPLDDEYYQIGQIKFAVEDGVWLLQINPRPGAPRVSRLVQIADLLRADLFDTEADLNAYMAWLDTPPDDGRPKIIQMSARKSP
jgi:hypothetical protein